LIKYIQQYRKWLILPLLITLLLIPTNVYGASVKPVCVYYYGGWSSSIRDRLIATSPEFVVLNYSAGSYGGGPGPADVKAVQDAGIKLLAYIFTGGMRGFLWDASDPTSNSRDAVRGFIQRVANAGYAGIYFDEGGLYSPVDGQSYQDSVLDRYLQSPGGITGNSKYNFDWGESWKGYTVEDYLSYAHSFGMITCEGLDDYRTSKLNPNVFAITEFVLTAEEYNGRSPTGAEIGNESHC